LLTASMICASFMFSRSIISILAPRIGIAAADRLPVYHTAATSLSVTSC
jgi:hypothetical protein